MGIFPRTWRPGIVSALVLLAASASVVAGEKEMQSLAAKKAAILGILHTKAVKALVNSAQDKVFAEYFTSTDEAKQALKPRIDKLALSVQSKFHVAEMCLIDDQGHEISRIVGNEIAPDADLSTEEASASFFDPTFAKNDKEVYVAPLYMSPDVNEWVIAYVTPMTHGGRKQAILHYEHNLANFQTELNKGLTGDSPFVVAIAEDGSIVSDSRAAVPTAKSGDSEDPAAYFKNAATEMPEAFQAMQSSPKGQGTYALNGSPHFGAYEKVEGWYVAAFERQ